MKKDDLARLHWIRKQREEKALKAVIARQGALLHAEQSLAEAKAAAEDHASNAREQERGALVALVGKELRRHELLNLQSSFDATADDQRRLEETQKQAVRQRDARRDELEKARAVFLRHHREAEKLGQVVEKRKMEAARKSLVFAEASDDEQHGRPVMEPLHSLAASRGEDA